MPWLSAPAQIVHDHAGVGEVHHYVGAAEQVERITGIDLAGQLQVVGGLDRAAYLRAHATLGAQHAYIDHRAPSPCCQGPDPSGRGRGARGRTLFHPVRAGLGPCAI